MLEVKIFFSNSNPSGLSSFKGRNVTKLSERGDKLTLHFKSGLRSVFPIAQILYYEVTDVGSL
jgi:hypothetical protein